MKIITLPVGQLKTNCYLIASNGEVGIIDPGDDGGYIIQEIQKQELTPVFVAATHGHFDHVLASMEVALTYKIPFYINERDEFLVKDAHKSAFYFTKALVEPILIKPDLVKEHDVLKVGNVKFEIIETPGHTPGSICLYSKTEKVLFCGDLVFKDMMIGRTDFKYSSGEDLWKSIGKISNLPKGTIIYPGHGETFFIKDLQLI